MTAARPAAALPANTRCARCGAPLHCGALADEARCWCRQLAPRAVDAALAGCLCLDCLAQRPPAAAAWAAPPIAPLADEALSRTIQQRIDRQTKPRGSLGALEALMLRIARIQATPAPVLDAPQVLVFAGDHGLAREGVSAYPPEVTAQMVANFLAGGAAISVLARRHGLALTVVDAGVAASLAPHPQLQQRKIAPGTQACTDGPAMTAAQCAAALEAGAAAVRSVPGNAVLLGEMGIGNSSAAALIMSRLLGLPLAQCAGAGTGLDERGIAHKRAVLQRALDAHAQAAAPLDVLAAFGGFELAQLTGAYLQAASERRLIVVDGFIAGAALLVAARLAPAVLDYCVFSHCSAEAGHAALLRALGGQPLLSLGLRLGEASGAALAWPLVASAVALLREMASFESAGVSTSRS